MAVAEARLDWPPPTYTSPDLYGDLSEKWVWMLSRPRNLDPRPTIVDDRLRGGIHVYGYVYEKRKAG